jgi:ATP-dependent exoDNAse (exonuclease V) alpha subunit
VRCKAAPVRTSSTIFCRVRTTVDGRTGAVHDYTRKSDIRHSEIMAPEAAPEWSLDRPALWSAVEAAERRKDAQLAREAQLALPRELDADRQIALLRSFVRDEFVSRGMVADFSLHDHTGSDGQPHAHVMLTMRSIDETGFGLKVRDWNSDELLVHWREQ